MSESVDEIVEYITVDDLTPNSRRINVKIKVVSKDEIKEVISKKTGETLKVSEALVGDETGTILLNLWNDTIDEIEEGKIYQINNGYISLFKGSMRLNIGKYGTYKEITDTEITNVNTDNNKSDQKFEVSQYRSRGRYRRPYGKSYTKRY
ncbi:MAG: single-stranded DNA-binding protein [Candidatus Odinarchaeia archaeon]